MTVSVQRHGHRVEIVQKADLVPGSIGWKARLLATGLFTTCIFLAAVSALLFGKLVAGGVPAAETWVGMIVMVPAVPCLAAAAFWEISAARPCRITISPAEIAVHYGSPLPRPFRIARRPAGRSPQGRGVSPHAPQSCEFTKPWQLQHHPQKPDTLCALRRAIDRSDG
ncbi:hypothetical protein [Paracoccus yeei]|uniref:hypothetical protein n=1 Tax=Paracoccus yeei TaxID=147645 RepID=UPI0028D5F23B|nr:hypothetical protein [Paracoccus yeei]